MQKTKHEVWFCVAIIMQMHTNRRDCSSIIGTQLCFLFIKWERQNNEQFSSNPKSPHTESDFRDLGSFPSATIYFLMIEEEKGNVNGHDHLFYGLRMQLVFTVWNFMGLFGDSPYSSHVQAKEESERLESEKFFPAHIDPTMPTPGAMVHLQSQMKSLKSLPLTKWMSQVCCECQGPGV